MNRTLLVRILSAVWVGAMVVLAIVATGFQMDRQADKNLYVARNVPGAFRGYALSTLARHEFADGNSGASLIYARELVSRQPVPAESLSLLGSSLLGEGDDKGALAVLVQSAQRGWRDGWTQYLMVGASLQMGETTVAGQRLLAIVRLNPDFDTVADLTDAVMENAPARAAFLSGVNARDNWGGDFFEWAARRDFSRQALLDVVQTLAKRHSRIDCLQLSRAARTFALAGRAWEARAVWSGLCSQGEAVSPTDLAFRDAVGPTGPFDWTFPGNGGASVDLEAVGGRTRLHFDSSESRTLVIAQRLLVLAPGEHTVRLVGEFGKSLSGGRPTARLACVTPDGGSSVLESMSNVGDRSVQSFTVPATGCVTQELSLLVPRGSGVLNEVRVDR